MKKVLLFLLAVFLLGAGCQNPPSQVTAPISVPAIEQQQIPVPRPVVTPSNTSSTTSKAFPVPYAPNGTYTNVSGDEIPSPYQAPSVPTGATAQCRDGSYSFSQHRSGTCSHHGGVAEWL